MGTFELTIKLGNNFNHNLSLLCLPQIFTSLSLSKDWAKSVQYNNDLSTRTSADNNYMTVSKYISKINESSLIDTIFNCKLNYSKNILPIMKHILPRLCQPYLIFELDFEIMSVFRYIRWKVFQSYLKKQYKQMPVELPEIPLGASYKKNKADIDKLILVSKDLLVKKVPCI